MAQAVADDYKSSLDDLNFNSKPHINMLTMLAEDNVKHAPLIVQTILDHISRVEPELKLPGLYLVDSIMKNVGDAYLSLFSQHMISLFTSVFEKVEESTRSLLFKLRQTWNDILPNKVLYGLDLRVKKLDPAWPITARQPSTKSIHINPRFISGSPSETNAGRDPRLIKVNKVPQTVSSQKSPASDVPGKSDQNSAVSVPKLTNAGKLNKTAVSKLAKETEKTSEKNSASSRQIPLSKSNKSTVKTVNQMTSLNKLPQEKEKVNLKPKADGTCSKVKNIDETRSISDNRKCAPSQGRNNSNIKSVKNAKETDKIPKGLQKRKLADFEKTKEVPMREPQVPTGSRRLVHVPKNNLLQTRTQSGLGKSKTDQGHDKGVTLSAEKVQNENEKSTQKTSKKEKILQENILGKKSTANKVKDQSSVDKPSERKGHVDEDLRIFNRDSRVPFKRKIESVLQENQPTDKKVKNEEEDKPDYGLEESPVLFGREDQDHRRPPNEFPELNAKGWAQYKETHPDEFKSPVPAIRGNMDGRMKSRKFMQHASDENFFPPDRLGRVRGTRGRFPSRFFGGRRGHFMRGSRGRGGSSNIGSVVLDPQAILHQAEEKFRTGKISKADYMELYHDLQKMLQSSEYQRYKEHISRIQNVDSYGTKGRDYENPGNMRSEINMRQNFPAQPILIQGPMFPPPDIKMFKLDNKMREIHFMDDKAFVILDDNEPRELTFKDEPKEVFVEGLPDPLILRFDGKSVEFNLDGKRHIMRFGTPAREIYINNHPYKAQFGGPPFAAMLEDGRVYEIRLGGPPPQVIVGEKLQYDPFSKLHRRKEDTFLKVSELNQKVSAEDEPETPPIHAALQDVDMRVKLVQSCITNNMKDVDWRHMPSPGDLSNDNPQRHTWSENLPTKGYENQQESQPGLASDIASYCERDEIQDALERHPKSQPSSDVICPTFTWVAPYPSEYPIRKLDEGPHGLPARPLPEWEDFHSYDNCDKPNWVHDEYSQESRVPPSLPPEQSHMYVNTRESNQHFEGHGNHFEEPRYMRPPMPYSRRPSYHDRRIRGRLRHVRLGPWPYPSTRQRSLEPRHIALNRGSLLRQPQPRAPNVPPQPLLPSPVFTTPDSISMEAVSSSQHDSHMPVPTIKTEIGGASEVVSETKSTAPVEIPTIDVEALLEKLVAAGIITSKPFEPSPSTEPEAPENAEESAKTEKDSVEEESVPKIELKPESLRVPHQGVVCALYKGSQCASCGMRYKEMQSEQYSRHLDWHFRMNRREKDGAKKAFSRRWYYEIDEWIQFEELEDFEERTPSYFELQAETEQAEPEVFPVVPSVPASEVPTEACFVCGETFQLFWVEDEEEWHLRDAVRHDGEVYHPGCYEDHKKSLKAEESENESEEAEKVIMNDEEMENIESEITPVLEALLNEICTKAEVIKIEAEESTSASENYELDLIANVLSDICSKIKLELETSILEGKPGEEEIIGLISESDMEVEDNVPKVESKMVVMQSGGITLKVKAESLQVHSPTTSTSERETKNNETSMESEEEDFRPPTPDPRFQVMPVVCKGQELSGLCCIM